MNVERIYYATSYLLDQTTLHKNVVGETQQYCQQQLSDDAQRSTLTSVPVA